MSNGYYLLHTDQKLVHDFARTIESLFKKDSYFGPFQVGSSLERKDWRDIDLRVLLKDEEYDSLNKVINLDMLGIAVSLWGQKVTGLPIDYQIQRLSNANSAFKGKQRNSVSIGSGL